VTHLKIVDDRRKKVIKSEKGGLFRAWQYCQKYGVFLLVAHVARKVRDTGIPSTHWFTRCTFGSKPVQSDFID
jgi:hypothetical protein